MYFRRNLLQSVRAERSDVARDTAAQTLSEVKRAMQINYFDDAELIRAQAEKYSGIME